MTADLVACLRRDGLTDLAAELPALPIAAGCRCDEPRCSSFYTGPVPGGGWGPRLVNELVLTDRHGPAVLDVVDGRIRFVELYDCPPLPAIVNVSKAAQRPESR